MTRRLIASLAILRTEDGRWITVYCSACGGWYPMGHGCQ